MIKVVESTKSNVLGISEVRVGELEMYAWFHHSRLEFASSSEASVFDKQ